MAIVPTQAPLASFNLEDIGKRWRQALLTLKLDGKAFSYLTSIPYSTLRSYMSGARPPSPEALVAAYRVCGLQPLWLLLGEGPMSRCDDSAAGEPRDWIVSVPALEEGAMPLCLPRQWLDARDLAAQSLVVVEVQGAPMEPILRHSDQVLVDRSDRDLRSGFAYALRQGHEILVRYSQRLPGGAILLSSANPAFPPYEVDLQTGHDFDVIGRVVASFHDWQHGG